MGGGSDEEDSDEESDKEKEERKSEAEAEHKSETNGSDCEAETEEDQDVGHIAQPSKAASSDSMPVEERALLEKKTKALLDEYWAAEDVGEAVLCVRELQAPGFHPSLVCQVHAHA
jgi:hypothetical protein